MYSTLYQLQDVCARLEMAHEVLEVFVPEMTFRLHDCADVPALLEELGRELLGGIGLTQSHRIIHDRIHALDSVKASS